MRNLQFYLDEVRHPYRSFYLWGDSIFFPIHFNPTKVRRMKKRGGKVIQRLDGCHLHPDGSEDIERNKRLSENYRHLADFIIFQSEYSKRLCAEILGCASVPSEIIHNGVHPHIFHPTEQPLAASEPIEFVTTGRFRSSVMLQPILTALDSLQNRFDFRLHICGPIESTPPPARPYLVLHGVQDIRQIATLLRRCHVFLFSQVNPPCSNSLLEGVASGLPLISFDSGSASELLPFSTELLVPVTADGVIHQAADLHADALAEKITLAVENLPRLQVIARQHASDYPFSRCGDAYRDVFARVLNGEVG